jgi:hypothetical protein
MQWVRNLSADHRAPLFIATMRDSRASIHNVPDAVMASMAAQFKDIP